MNKYFEYTITDTSIQTVGDLLFNFGSFINGFGNKNESNLQRATDFMLYNGDIVGGETNLEKILAAHSTEAQLDLDLPNRSDYDKFPIKFNTAVLIPFSAIDRDIIPLFGDAVDSVDSPAFLAKAFKDFYTDKNNFREIETKLKSLGSYKEMFNHCSVWLWSKSLSSELKGNALINNDNLINITPYISDMNTTVNKNGGLFNFTIDAILGRWNEETEIWEIDKSAMKELKTGEYVSHSRIRNNNQRRASYFFHNIIQENDLVFIRFERLKSEPDRKNDNTFIVNKTELQFKNYDMIGLVDGQREVSNFAGNDVRIQVYGRDLMKLFIEDGVYFYPFDFIDGGIFANANKDKELRLKRYDGQLISRFQLGYKRISNVLQFLINALGTIKICSDTLFEPYGDRRTEVFRLSDEELKKIVDTNEEIEKEKHDEDLKLIRKSREESNLTIIESDDVTEAQAIVDEDKAIEDVYREIQRFFRVADFKEGDATLSKLRNDTKSWTGEFEFDGVIIKENEIPDSLYGQLYVTKIKKKTTGSPNSGKEPTESAKTCLKKMVENYFKRKERNKHVPKDFVKEPLKGIWSIVKLIIDHTVHDRLLVDSSIGNEHGSLINAVRKICQEPFVEFYGDTYGDQYYLTVRKPPYDREGFLSLLEGCILDENGKPTSSSPIVVDIDDDDILEENLEYGAEGFSWYHLNPMGNIQGEDFNFAFLRAVYLKEYADLFGSRPLDIRTNYIPFIPFENGENKRGVAYMLRQGIKDLQFLIQSHAYMPFARRGTLTISLGNRRLKRGCLVRLTSTGEVGIVEAVTHNIGFSLNSIDRTTTISIDRLLVEKYIKTTAASDSDNTQVSYFDLVDTTVDESVFQDKELTVTKGAEIMSNWKVNPEVLNFFLKASQFK